MSHINGDMVTSRLASWESLFGQFGLFLEIDSKWRGTAYERHIDIVQCAEAIRSEYEESIGRKGSLQYDDGSLHDLFLKLAELDRSRTVSEDSKTINVLQMRCVVYSWKLLRQEQWWILYWWLLKDIVRVSLCRQNKEK